MLETEAATDLLIARRKNDATPGPGNGVCRPRKGRTARADNSYQSRKAVVGFFYAQLPFDHAWRRARDGRTILVIGIDRDALRRGLSSRHIAREYNGLLSRVSFRHHH